MGLGGDARPPGTPPGPAHVPRVASQAAWARGRGRGSLLWGAGGSHELRAVREGIHLSSCMTKMHSPSFIPPTHTIHHHTHRHPRQDAGQHAAATAFVLV